MNSIRNSAKAIIIADECLLTIKNQDEEGFWYILPARCQRECREELSVDINVGDLVCMREYIGRNHEFAHDVDVHQIEFMFACSIHDGAQVGTGEQPDQWQVGYEWIPLDQLEDYRFYPKTLRRLLADYRQSQHPIYLGDVN